MDLQSHKTTEVFPQELTWLYGDPAAAFAKATEVAIHMTPLAGATEKAKHWPDGFIKPGTLLALHTSGTYDTYWSPYVADQSPDTGLTTVGAILLNGAHVNEYAGGSHSLVVHGSALLAGLECQLFLSKLPGLLDNAGADRAVIAGDLSASWVNMDY